MKLGYTIYAQQGDNKRPDGCVGITFPPTPSLTYEEVHNLIDQLQEIARQMRRGAKISD